MAEADQADARLTLLEPQSGSYFTATPGLLELTLCEDRHRTSLNGEEYAETTLADVERFRELCAAGRTRGATVVVSVNVNLP